MRREYLILLIWLIGVSCKQLDSKDNQNRLNKCGKKMITIPKDPGENGTEISLEPDDWIVRVANPGGVKPSYDSSGTFISKRHIITNSQPILDEDFTLNLDGTNFHPDKLCTGDMDQSHIEVPNKYVKNIKITSGFCISDKKCPTKQFKPVKAWILDYCARERKFYVARKVRFSMLIEVKETAKSFVCVADNRSLLENKDTMHVYGLEFVDGINGTGLLKYQNHKRIEVSETNITIEKYYAEGDRGGPLIKNDNDVATIVGIGASPGQGESFNEAVFFRIDGYEAILCDVAGICPGDRIVTTVEPTTITTPSPSSTCTPKTSRKARPQQFLFAATL